MNTQEYIASGVLDLYATGLLSPIEMAEVERMAALYPEVREELDAITETLDSYAKLHAIEPPAHLKEKIIQTVIHSSVSHSSTVLPETNAGFKQIQMPAASNDFENNTSDFNWWAVAASVLLLISAGLNFYFYNNWQKTENQYQVALAAQNQYAQQIHQVNQKLEITASEMAVITHTKTQKVNLQGLKNSPESSVVVFWNTSTKDVFLKIAELPAPPSGKQYQLWALENGKPVDAGMVPVTLDAAGIQKMKTINNAQAFAITLEPQGGSANPTMEQMYVMGQI